MILCDIKPITQEFKIQGMSDDFIKLESDGVCSRLFNLTKQKVYIEQNNCVVDIKHNCRGLKTF